MVLAGLEGLGLCKYSTINVLLRALHGVQTTNYKLISVSTSASKYLSFMSRWRHLFIGHFKYQGYTVAGLQVYLQLNTELQQMINRYIGTGAGAYDTHLHVLKNYAKMPFLNLKVPLPHF